ncbi:hypothetical protein KH5H1_24940 [Corallococcus caeni]|nr:hypothetical protein KH5H1_24940 [Corallococcus sp. KH5-1]
MSVRSDSSVRSDNVSGGLVRARGIDDSSVSSGSGGIGDEVRGHLRDRRLSGNRVDGRKRDRTEGDRALPHRRRHDGLVASLGGRLREDGEEDPGLPLVAFGEAAADVGRYVMDVPASHLVQEEVDVRELGLDIGPGSCGETIATDDALARASQAFLSAGRTVHGASPSTTTVPRRMPWKDRGLIPTGVRRGRGGCAGRCTGAHPAPLAGRRESWDRGGHEHGTDIEAHRGPGRRGDGRGHPRGDA